MTSIAGTKAWVTLEVPLEEIHLTIEVIYPIVAEPEVESSSNS